MVLILGAVLFWGVANFLFKVATAKASPISVLLGEVLGIIAGTLMIVCLDRSALASLGKTGYAWSVAGGAILIAGAYLFLRALPHVNLAIAMPFSSLNVLVSALLGVLILSERLTNTQIAGGILMIFGAVLLGMSFE